MKATWAKWYAKHKEDQQSYQRTYYHSNPGYLRNYTFIRKYGLTSEDVDRIAAEQNWCCKLCRQPTPKLVVDHDHSTGKVRGLLCNRCNHGLGHFKDSTDTLRAAIEYLDASRES